MSKTPTDPDDWSGASDALFRSARQDHEPSTADRERVRQALARRLAEGSNVPATDTPTETTVELARKGAAGLSQVVKFGLGALVVMLSVAAFLRVREATEHANSKPPTAAASGSFLPPASPPVPSSEGPGTQAEESPAGPKARGEEAQKATAERAAAPRAQSEVPPRATARVRERSPVALAPARVRSPVVIGPKPSAAEPGVAAQSAAVAPSSSSERTEPAPPSARPVAASRANSTREPSVEPSAPARNEGSADARAELALLRRIQAGVTEADYAEVLSLCAQHERHWPDGTFVQEREGLRAIAACKSHASDAAALARAFFSAYPRSPLAPRVREACTAPRKTVAP